MTPRRSASKAVADPQVMRPDPGIVDQHVEPRAGRVDSGHELLSIGFIGDVKMVRRGRKALVAQAPADVSHLLAEHISDMHMRAGTRKTPCDRSSQATSCAGDADG
jgi:hypothetical protein